MNHFLALLTFSVALAVAGCACKTDQPANRPADPAASSAASGEPVDLHNTVCPVSGDNVEKSSRLTETYDGKVYHLCCADCVKPFKADPRKYARAVANDPAKYGVAKSQ